MISAQDRRPPIDCMYERVILKLNSKTIYKNILKQLHDVMRSKSKVDQEKKHEEIIKYMHWLTFSNGTSGLISA